MEKKRSERKEKLLIFALNLLIAASMAMLCLYFNKSERDRHEAAAMQSFENIADSMQQVAAGYMLFQQQACNDWAQYIEDQNMSLEQALEYVNQTNTVQGIMAHILKKDTLKGYSSEADENGNNQVDYSAFASEFSDIFRELVFAEDKPYSGTVTRNYINPINGMPVVSFIHEVTLADNEDYLLLRTVPLADLSKNWAFQVGNEAARMTVITGDGDYVIQSRGKEYNNFWDKIQTANNFTDTEIENVQNLLTQPGITSMELLNADGVLCLYVSVPSHNVKNLYYISDVPLATFTDSDTNYNVVWVVGIGMALLLLVNVCYILHLNRILSVSIDQTRKANEAKTQFLSSMSHDIRTPMNAIVGMTTIAMRHLNDPEQIQDCLAKISLASSHLLTLINNVLDISKVESGKMSLNPVSFSLKDSINNLINIVRTQIKEKGLEFEVHIHHVDYEYLYGDEVRLNQIFINLLSNAVKYTAPGGKVILSLEEKPDPDHSDQVLLSYKVCDTGIGMSQEFQKVMYDTFARAVDTRIDKIQGSGLGLAITKQMVDLMGGTIECKSELHHGTCFKVELPLPIAKEPVKHQTLPDLKLLLVDDDEIFLSTTSEILQDLGCHPDLAISGKQAVEMVREKHEAGQDYPVIILDWKMPGMNGIETAKAIRKITGEDVSIIIVSSYDRSDIEKEARQAGVNGFINKPLFYSSCYQTLSSILQTDLPEKEEDQEQLKELPNLHLLVAEDNEMNWEIIDELLEYYGVKCTRAVNGKEAVEMLVKDGCYDGILMDIQMPVMNGIEATKAIRALKDPQFAQIPIIAMTADAFAEDIQNCLNAGMDGHVAKPVDLTKLFAELNKIIQKQNNKH